MRPANVQLVVVIRSKKLRKQLPLSQQEAFRCDRARNLVLLFVLITTKFQNHQSSDQIIRYQFCILIEDCRIRSRVKHFYFIQYQQSLLINVNPNWKRPDIQYYLTTMKTYILLVLLIYFAVLDVCVRTIYRYNQFQWRNCRRHIYSD